MQYLKPDDVKKLLAASDSFNIATFMRTCKNLWGGEEGLAQCWKDTYDAAPAGSQIRYVILNGICALMKTYSEVNNPYAHMTMEDLEAEAKRLYGSLAARMERMGETRCLPPGNGSGQG